MQLRCKSSVKRLVSAILRPKMVLIWSFKCGWIWNWRVRWFIAGWKVPGKFIKYILIKLY